MFSNLKSLFIPPEERRVIFSINSGRSGSKYLSELLGTAAEVKSFHEAHPQMIDEYLRLVTTAPYRDSFEKRKIKVEGIKETLRGMSRGDVYAESNHMFIKTFFDVVVDAFKNLDVIILRRDLAPVLKSFIELNYFTDKNPHSPRWMINPSAVTAAVRPLAPDSDMDQFDLSIAYLIDIEARAQRFQRDYAHVPTHEVWLEQLNDRNFVQQFFKNLRITPTDETWTLLGAPANPKSHRKEKFQNPTTLEICRERIQRYIARAQEQGIELPPNLPFDPEPASTSRR